MKKETVASMIDHTLLAPEAGTEKIRELCSDAKKYRFASVCVNPVHVRQAASELADSNVRVCTVIGFPLGANASAVKAFEADHAIKDGADEVDMVIDIGAAKDGRFGDVEADIKAVTDSARDAAKKAGKSVVVKVILETCFLSDEEIASCCTCAVKAGADFVKTSTGFANPKGDDGKPLPNGATVHHVELMRKTVGSALGVKASGGIRSAETALAMLSAGANRIGTSSGVKIVEDWDESAAVKGC